VGRVTSADNALGFVLERMVGLKTMEVENQKLRPMHVLEWRPFLGSYKNHEHLWIIIDGEMYVGRYCKALHCRKTVKEGEGPLMHHTVLANVVVGNDGLLQTVVDKTVEPFEVEASHVAVVWQPEDVLEREPEGYVLYDQWQSDGAAETARRKEQEGGRKVRKRKGVPT
jgi:hypothetical protein